MQWFERSHQEHKDALVAIPNGAHLAGGPRQRSQQMEKLKAEGFKNGFPDLFLALPKGGYHGLFIEMKRTKESSTSKEQKHWNAYLNAVGYRSEICKGWEAAKEVISEYMAHV